MQENNNKNTKTDKDSRFIHFWGGKKLVFTLVIFILIALLIMLFNQVSFIFKPLQITFSTIVAPLILAVVFYHLLDPLISWMEKRGLKRKFGTAIVFVLSIVLIGYGIILLVPILSEQISEFVLAFPDYVDALKQRSEEIVSGSIFESYYKNAMNSLDRIVGDVPAKVMDWVGSSSQEIVSVFSTISTVVSVIVTFPVILFFMLADKGKFKPFMMKIIPPIFRDAIQTVSTRISSVVRSYIQGEIIVALSLGVLLFFGYLIIGLDYAFVLATIAAITAIVPFIGATIGIIPALIVAAFTSPGMLLKMAIVWGVGQFVQGNIIEPTIMGKNLKMYPLTIIIVLLVMGNIFGIIGVILGVPLFAMIKVILEYLLEQFKKRYNRYFSEVAGPYDVDRDLAGDTTHYDDVGNVEKDSSDESNEKDKENDSE
ncbi:Predicted PurR-regulated permease PerM [Carnobacterium iners]|uniref:Predicted PurR-regulated permease PerM n=1 Tax=Carnobacterium iners TaxID=1073423 RepID=A0A1X7ND45_9LACT|nr:AI-2E family transporter [Carnobacterium iners]SEK36634.1 Predicted PurR-regulated permease PerM [Carnobacterium iners]SMH35567.1 Predicted PurR-regulated permease PerM [Carnobacterium iners]